MCFVLYAGTTKPLSRREWNESARELSVCALTDRESVVKHHFSKPEVQYIGSTSGCGCGFPNVILENMQNGEWTEAMSESLKQNEEEIQNRKALVELLRGCGESIVELYGTWDGSDGNLAKAPVFRERVSLASILTDGFRFKEGCLYTVEQETNEESP